MKDQILVVMPAYNRSAYLSESIRSVISQTYPHWKLIIVDDGSTDNTFEISRQFASLDSRIKVIQIDHTGISNARNAALRLIDETVEYVSFLDSDDLWEPEALEVLLTTLQKHPEFIGVHGVGKFIDQHGRTTTNGKAVRWPDRRKGIQGYRPANWPDDRPTGFAVLAYGNFIPTGAILLRKSVFRIAGLFDPEAIIYSDWDMWLRITALSPIVFINSILYSYRIHPDNLDKPRDLVFERVEKMFSKLYHSDLTNGMQKELILSGYRKHQLFYAHRVAKSAAKKLIKMQFDVFVSEMKETIKRLKEAFSVNPFGDSDFFEVVDPISRRQQS